MSTADTDTITYDTVAPTITLSSFTGGGIYSGNAAASNENITWTAADAVNLGATPITLDYSDDGGSTWTNIASNEANDSTYSWDLPAIDQSDVRVRVTVIDSAGNSSTSSSASNLTIDSSAPAFTAASFVVNSGSATTINNNLLIDFQASDSLTNITHVCYQYNNTSAPASSADCWEAITAATSISLTSQPFRVGFSSGAYNVYGWLKDAAGNISTLTSAGSGTDGTDLDTITYNPGTPPTIVNVIATNTDSPTSPPTSAEKIITSGSDVYIQWNASDTEGFGGTPISIEYTTDDSTYSSVASGLVNGSNGACTVGGSYTGCYKWTGGSPSSNYFGVRVTATDSSSQSTSQESLPVNVSVINFLAGNTDPGTGSSASSALFVGLGYSSSVPDLYSFAVSSTGVVYFRDLTRGILKIDPSDGVLRQYIPLDASAASTNGDGGAIASATVKVPHSIELDYNDDLYIFDYDRIRKVDTSAGTIDTLIGGGVSTADSIASATDLQINAIGSLGNGSVPTYPFIILPNGDIYFSSEPHVDTPVNGSRFRKYTAATGAISSLILTGTGHSSDGSADLYNDCRVNRMGLRFDPLTSTINTAMIDISNISTISANCNAPAAEFANVNPSTWVSQGPHPTITTGTAQLIFGYLRSGKNGELYAVSRYYGTLFAYDGTSNSWDVLAGTLSTGGALCENGEAFDNTCALEVKDMYVTKTGRIYFYERGLIRTVDDNGNVYTLYGQMLDFGDGGLATSARLDTVKQFDFWDDGGTDKLVLLDSGQKRIRELTMGGNINTVAGTGRTGSPNTTDLATNQPYLIINNSSVGVHPTNGNIYSSRSGSQISYLDRTTGKWVDLVGGGANNWFDPATDGSNDINFLAVPGVHGGLRILGIDSSEIQVAAHGYSAGYYNPKILSYDLTTGNQTTIAGVTAGSTISSGQSWCADGTAAGSCDVNISFYQLNASYDSQSSKWVYGQSYKTELRYFDGSNNSQTLVTLPRQVHTFAYKHTATVNKVYYCAYSVDTMYEYDIDTSTETALDWPISSMSCGLGGYHDVQNMRYHPGRDSIIFVYKRNGLYGVAEYLLNP